MEIHLILSEYTTLYSTFIRFCFNDVLDIKAQARILKKNCVKICFKMFLKQQIQKANLLSAQKYFKEKLSFSNSFQ